jgi:hypothetical protein
METIMENRFDRSLFINLVFAGGNPDVAYLSTSKYTIEQYEAAIETDEYKEFAKKIEKQFIENADLLLMGNLYRAQEAMMMVGPDDKNYPQIMRAYTEMLRLTAPIVERLSKVRAEVNAFNGLKLVIKGAEEKV